ncbi:MAG TPA: hypothetical protein VM261_17375 [Kofleriaceae bacterium]|nr:hypothetical protein [Kofleriaceae bacterium]
MSKQFRISYGVLAALFVGACSVPSVNFTGTDGGGGDDDSDAMPDAPAVVELQVSTSTVTVDEAATQTFTVQLTAAPSSDVTVSVDSDDDNRVGVVPGTIVFTSTNWNQARTITVSGREDADTENEAVDVTLSSSVGNETVAVTVTDNDQLRIIATPATNVEVTEGSTSTLAVHLSAQPSGPVTVMVMSSDTAAAAVSPATLSFGTGTWDLDQQVVISGTPDPDIVDGTAMITLNATGLTATVVPVRVVDDDQLLIVPSTTNLGTVNEGATTTFTVRLSQQPPANVSVTVMSSDASILTVAPSPLTFTTVNWMTPQTVTATLPADVDVADETATITLTATALATRTISANIDDDDVQSIVPTPATVDITEGMSRNFNVHLAFQPAADVTLTVTSLNTGLAMVAPSSLTFTPSNYDQNQPVVVTSPEDVDIASGVTSVRLESVAANLMRDVSVSVTDNDQLLIETNTTSVALGEAGTAMFSVRLNAMPGGTVTVSASSGDQTAATVSPGTLMFTPANYNTYQMVTVTGVADSDLTAENVTLTLSAPSVPNTTVSATVTDDDVQGVVVSSATLQVGEAGNGTIGVSLAFMPAANTVVNVASMDITQATVSPATLTFTPANYATPQNITIAGVNDADGVDDNVNVNLTATGVTPAAVAVTVQDNDVLGIETVSSITVGEAGTASFNVRLSAMPLADTTVMVMSSDVSAATAAPAMLTFTTANYNTFQAVTLTGVSDADAINDSITVNLTATGLTSRTVTTTVQDDDTQDILLTTTTLTVGEAGSGTFGVRLSAMPPSDVVVTVASANTNKASASPSMLTFTPANYATNQTVTVSGVDDLDLAQESVAVNMSSPSLPTRTVTTTVTDNDTQVVEATTTGPFEIGEGISGVVGFRLRYMPAASATVTVTAGAGVTAVPGTLTFTTANYNTYQNVTVTGIDDADAVDVTTTVTASAPSATSAVVQFVVDDDDILELETAVASITVNEGANQTFGVRLTAQPTASTVVSIGSSDTTVASVNTPTTLTFTTSNWNTYQNASIAGVEDVDTTADAATITVSATGLSSKTVGVTINDNDTLTIVAMPTSVSVNEGASTTFNVTLSNQPSSNVSVGIASSNGAVMTIGNNPATLSFTTSNWNTAQTVTVNGVADADAIDGSANAVLSSLVTVNRNVAVTVLDDDITLTDLSLQMGPAAGGGTAQVTGTGFTAAVTGTMSNNNITSWMATTNTGGSFTVPAKSVANSNWSDLRLVKAGNSVTIPRAHYYGQWQAGTGASGGLAWTVRTAGASLVYAGMHDGFYVSTNNGVSYTRAAAGLDNEPIKDIAVHPTNSDMVYVPTRQGVYVTTNRGTTWARAGNLTSETRCVAINGTNPQVVFACTNTDLQRSTDGGTTWAAVATGLSSPTYLAFTTNGQIGWLGTNNGLYRSTDSGATWAPANGNLTGSVFVGSVAAHPTLGSTAYTSVNSSIYKTVDGGTSWTNVATFYASAIAVNPTTPSIVYAATQNGIIKSTDSGVTWPTPIISGMPTWAQSSTSVTLRASAPSEIHQTGYTGIYRSTNAAQSWAKSDAGLDTYAAVSIEPHPTTPGTVLMGGDSGAWRSTDYGATWTQIMSGVTGTNASVNSIAYAPSQPTTVYMSFQANSVYKSTDGGSTWTACGLQSAGALAVDPTNPQVVYAVHYPDRVMKSVNGCSSFTPMNSGIPVNHDIYDVVAVGTYVVATDGADGIYRSTNGGTSWALSNSGFPTGGAYYMTVDYSGAIYVVPSSASRVYRSADGGASWTLFSNFGTAVAVDPQRPATAYLAYYNNVYRTLNAFTSTANFTTGLPSYTCCTFSAIAIDKDGAAVYYGPPQRGFLRIAP